MTAFIFPDILMGIVNGTEWIFIIAIVAIIIFGAKKIPELARSLGKASSEYEKAKVMAANELEKIKGMGVPLQTIQRSSERSPLHWELIIQGRLIPNLGILFNQRLVN